MPPIKIKFQISLTHLHPFAPIIKMPPNLKKTFSNYLTHLPPIAPNWEKNCPQLPPI